MEVETRPQRGRLVYKGGGSSRDYSTEDAIGNFQNGSNTVCSEYMYMNIYMYIQIYIAIYLCLYVCLYVRMYVCMLNCIYVCMYACMYKYVYYLTFHITYQEAQLVQGQDHGIVC